MFRFWRAYITQIPIEVVERNGDDCQFIYEKQGDRLTYMGDVRVITALYTPFIKLWMSSAKP